MASDCIYAFVYTDQYARLYSSGILYISNELETQLSWRRLLKYGLNRIMIGL